MFFILRNNDKYVNALLGLGYKTIYSIRAIWAMPRAVALLALGPNPPQSTSSFITNDLNI
jgi:hypothetical protein